MSQIHHSQRTVVQLPLRSYVESNEEMTESDCNVQEDDERTGGGSASDSGRSIASSVSTEPFFSGQSVTLEAQPFPVETNATNSSSQTQSQPQIESEANSSANNNEQEIRDSTESSTSAQPSEVHYEDSNDSQDTNESKGQEIASNVDNADNNDVINVYSSGDEDDAKNADRKRYFMTWRDGLVEKITYFRMSISDWLQRPFLIELTNFTSTSFVDFVEMNSSIANKRSISVTFNVLQDLPNFYGNIKVLVESPNGALDMELVNKTIDCCEFFRNRKSEPLLQLLWRALNFTKTGVVPKSCPVRKNVYYLKNVVIDPEDFPPALPSKRLMANVTMMTKIRSNFKSLFNYVLHFQIKQKTEVVQEKIN